MITWKNGGREIGGAKREGKWGIPIPAEMFHGKKLKYFLKNEFGQMTYRMLPQRREISEKWNHKQEFSKFHFGWKIKNSAIIFSGNIGGISTGQESRR